MKETTVELRPILLSDLAKEVVERSGQNIYSCYQCRRCASGCPVGEESGITPDRLIRCILLGDRESALNNLLVWKCLACYTCGQRCPNNIQTARITETLKQMSKKEHLVPLESGVAAFHNAFMKSVSHFGKVNEIELGGLYQLKKTVIDIKKGLFKDIIKTFAEQLRLGMKMLKKKRMHIAFFSIKGFSEIKNIFRKSGT
ncbi:MAG: 4Fe-4S dicluster domain-containing protein [Nitrospiraceae bacterium]|nr:4Fe-4S dicluster domain-containing protein [Nitrospiraceae bacterium]